MKGLLNRAQVNNAIWKVLNTQFKKDARDAFKVVEDAGYTIYKNGCSRWVVSNPATERYINLSETGWKRYTKTVIQHGPYVCMQRRLTDEEMRLNTSKFDFVGCLDKPINKARYTLNNTWNKPKTAHEKFNDIKQARHMAEVYKKDIENVQKKIAELQKDLVRYAKYQAEYEQKAVELKKQYGVA